MLLEETAAQSKYVFLFITEFNILFYYVSDGENEYYLSVHLPVSEVYFLQKIHERNDGS